MQAHDFITHIAIFYNTYANQSVNAEINYSLLPLGFINFFQKLMHTDPRFIAAIFT